MLIPFWGPHSPKLAEWTSAVSKLHDWHRAPDTLKTAGLHVLELFRIRSLCCYSIFPFLLELALTGTAEIKSPQGY